MTSLTYTRGQPFRLDATYEAPGGGAVSMADWKFTLRWLYNVSAETDDLRVTVDDPQTYFTVDPANDGTINKVRVSIPADVMAQLPYPEYTLEFKGVPTNDDPVVLFYGSVDMEGLRQS